MKDNQALIVVDVQKDFLETGALPVKEGSQVVPVINRIIPKFKNVVFTQDWHPQGHISFASSHPGIAPYSTIDVSYGKQVLWPEHCVQNTSGAEFAEGLNTENGDCFVKKGAHSDIDSYSAFLEADRKTKTDLGVWLRSQGITEVFVCGLATDFCVSWTALDAAGLRVSVIEDASRGIDVNGSLEGARAAWKKRGIKRIDSSEIN
jgi:nicotinamidase/pyrazinamidase